MADHLHALPAGHRLHEYRIDRVLGSGGFGITYYARDTHLNKPVAVKEYFPNDFAVRVNVTAVRPRSTSDAGNYQWGLKRFLDEARTLARFRHRHLNEVYRLFEANGTAYMVLEYIEGETLSAWLRREPRLEENQLRRLLDELLSGLDEVHKAGFVHRYVKPGNIILRVDGSAVLLDFGASRQLVGQRSRSMTSVLTPGYAPIEQYAGQADDVGPWSDLYALGMVAYRCISGLGESELPDAVSRMKLARKGGQDLKPAVEIVRGRYAEDLLKAVDWSIKVDEDDRPQSVTALRDVLRERDRAAEAERSRFFRAANRQPAPDACDDNGWTDLHTAAVMNAVALARFLVEGGAKVDARLKNDGEALTDDLKSLLRKLTGDKKFDGWHRTGNTPLHTAARKNAREVAEYLVSAGADLNAKNDVGVTPLHYAAYKNAREVMECLVTSGADVNAEDKYDQTPLHLAAWKNAREVAEYLVTSGADVEAKDDTGKTPLHTAVQENARDAVRKNAREVMECLVASGADVNAEDKYGNTPLHTAAGKNAREVVEYLVASGADVEAKDDNGNTLLHDAARENAREVVKYLVTSGADVNAEDKYGQTPLHWAAQENAREVAEYLVEYGADLNAKATPLHSGGFGGKAREVAANLMEAGSVMEAVALAILLVEYNDYDDDTLKDDLNLLRELERITRGEEEEFEVFGEFYGTGATPLHYLAVEKKAREVVEYLVASGADVNAKELAILLVEYDDYDEDTLRHDLNLLRELTTGEEFEGFYRTGATPLHLAVQKNAREVVEYLVEAGADVNAQDKDFATPLHDALRENDRQIVEYLVASGADVNAKGGFDETPLHYAAWRYDRQMVEYLVASGADMNANSIFFGMPLHVAARAGDREVVKYLVAAGADVKAKNTFGGTPLHNAAYENARDVAKYLVAAGADVNARNDNGETPLHLAAEKYAREVSFLIGLPWKSKLNLAVEKYAREVAEYLVKAGAELNAKNNHGETPLAVAVRYGATETAEFLRSRGAL